MARVYRNEKNHTLFAQPGNDFPEVSSFLDAEKRPLLMTIVFVDHTAEVDSNVAEYLIDKKLAFKHISEVNQSRIITAHA